MKVISDTNPTLVETYIEFATKRYAVNINTIYNDGVYSFEQVVIPAGRWEYSGVVDALIQHKYPIDKMLAVINNYLLDPNDPDTLKDFNEMQQWRLQAKLSPLKHFNLISD